jgi:hypothetical protein
MLTNRVVRILPNFYISGWLNSSALVNQKRRKRLFDLHRPFAGMTYKPTGRVQKLAKLCIQ